MHWHMLLFLITGVTAQRPTVTLTDGMYTGTTTRVGDKTVNQFFGIPFATRPERWAPAQPRPIGTEKHDATKQPSACIQQSEGSGGGAVTASESEDCLFLNVFAPALGTTTAGLPIIVWYHGGGLFSGSIGMGGRPQPDASSFAASQDIIVVAVQYRLGAFGFPGFLAELGPEGQNPGFRDQKLALQWVQANIAAFGGDPAKVTIMGESGGGVSVDGLLISSGGDKVPLFRAAIAMSGSLHTFNSGIVGGVGSYMTGLGVGNIAGEAPLVTLGKKNGCTTAESVVKCLRAKSGAELKSAISKAQLLFAPVEDGGKTNYMDSDTARLTGKIAKVPVMLGATFQEAQGFVGRLGDRTVEDWARIIYPSNTTAQNAVAAAYALGKGLKTASGAILQLHSDYQFQCIEAHDATIMARANIPTYRYIFNASTGGVSHGSEMSYIWAGGSATGVAGNLGRVMQAAWAKFVKDPSNGPASGWVRYGSAEKDLANLGGEGDRKSITMIAPSVMDSRCSVWYAAYSSARPEKEAL